MASHGQAINDLPIRPAKACRSSKERRIAVGDAVTDASSTGMVRSHRSSAMTSPRSRDAPLEPVSLRAEISQDRCHLERVVVDQVRDLDEQIHLASLAVRPCHFQSRRFSYSIQIGSRIVPSRSGQPTMRKSICLSTAPRFGGAPRTGTVGILSDALLPVSPGSCWT